MTMTVSRFREEFADREAIRDCLYRYARGVDRCEEALVRSAYWEDAIDDHVLFQGGREELIAWAMPILRSMIQRQHSISNVLIRIRGDQADVESYFYGYHRIDNDGACIDSIQSGRYLDRFERRDDEWRIIERRVLVDWFRDYTDAADWEKGPLGQPTEFGTAWPDDPSYRLLKRLAAERPATPS